MFTELQGSTYRWLWAATFNRRTPHVYYEYEAGPSAETALNPGEKDRHMQYLFALLTLPQ